MEVDCCHNFQDTGHDGPPVPRQHRSHWLDPPDDKGRWLVDAMIRPCRPRPMRLLQAHESAILTATIISAGMPQGSEKRHRVRIASGSRIRPPGRTPAVAIAASKH